MRYFLFIILFSLCFTSQAQNLVPNPSFEDTLGCPNSQDQLYLSNHWTSFGGSSDYFNRCSQGTESVPLNSAGYQTAATGNAYGGFFGYNIVYDDREYVGSQLLSPLISGIKYYISFKVSLADSSYYAINNIGVLFSTIPYNENTSPMTITNRANIWSTDIISDKINWTTVSGSFLADSNYSYIILGNFFADSLTNKISTSNPHGPFIDFAYYYVDDVCVSTDSLTCNIIDGYPTLSNEQIQIYPNPVSQTLSIKTSEHNIKAVCRNILGQQEYASPQFSGDLSIDVSRWMEGMYFIEISDAKDRRVRGLKVVVDR